MVGGHDAMPINYIVHIVINCVWQSLPVIGAWNIIRWIVWHKYPARERTKQRKREMGLWILGVYLICLVQITVFRFGIHWVTFDIVRQTNWQPLMTLALLAPWAKFYNIVGNIVWFVPLGLLWPQVWPKWRFWQVALLGCGLSIMIEGLQYLFYTGITDVDDVIFNTLGAAIGYLMQSAWCRMKAKKCHK